ncbi:hypothetical protein [Fusobacterium sp. SYSU M8D902]|uniref:hypothetical protein n=1 Tax=Fusobacterium sp. SYSU M8D902 TaxID=3159562 RepID=UPI0032E3B004
MNFKNYNLQKKFSIRETLKTKSLTNMLVKNGKTLSVVMVMCILSQVSMSANGLPFYDKLELAIKIMQVVGSAIAILSFFGGIYFMSEGQREAVKKCAWFVGVGIVTGNIQWFADQFGLMAGAIFA